MNINEGNKVVHVGDFVKLKITRNKDKAGESSEISYIQIIEGKPDEPLNYWSMFGIRRASKNSPYKVLMGQREGFDTNIDTPGGKLAIALLTVFSYDEVIEGLEDLRKIEIINNEKVIKYSK